MNLRISIIQTELIRQDKTACLKLFEDKIASIGETDLVVLPEMFSTGFDISNTDLAESIEGETMVCIKKWSKTYNTAICGSFFCVSENRFYNRFFFITPDGKSYFYDKRHLFIGDEKKIFTSGENRLIINYKGVRFLPVICYDIRFPIWCRNRDDYDVLICVANWPEVRRDAWTTLVRARAIENASYAVACNILGNDLHERYHSGHSLLVDYKGKTEDLENNDCCRTYTIDTERLAEFRKKFPVLNDRDTDEK